MKQVSVILSRSFLPELTHSLLFCQLRKGDMLRKGQEGHVRSERDVRCKITLSQDLLC